MSGFAGVDRSESAGTVSEATRGKADQQHQLVSAEHERKGTEESAETACIGERPVSVPTVGAR